MSLKIFTQNLRSAWNNPNFILGTEKVWIDSIMPTMIGSTNAEFNIENAEKISTLFTCIKILSETLSRMPLNIYSDKGQGRTVDKEDYRYPILHYNPNNWTNQQTFFSALEYWRNLKGNSFARIYRNGNGKLKSLVLIPPSRVIGYNIINDELYYKIKIDENTEQKINASEILHFKGITKDGIWGVSALEALKMNLSSSYQGIQTLENFYKNNAVSPKAIKSTVTGANQKALLEAIEEFNKKYVGAINAGKMITLPPNSELQDMSMNFADAVFIETFKFNASQISSLFGIPPEMVGLFEASKFNNVEQLQKNFYINAIAAIARLYRQEMEHKLLTTEERLGGISIEFNTMSMVELDAATRSAYLKTMTGMGVATINDVAKLEGFSTYPEGDKHYIPGNYLTVEQIAGKTDSSTNIINKDSSLNI